MNCGNGRCEDGVNSFMCVCNPSYTGNLCDIIEADNCEGENCNGNGRCEDGVNSFACVCDPGFAGKLCQQSKLLLFYVLYPNKM